jgi:hypothetical protein
MGIYYFPSEFVYWTKYKKHSEMKSVFTKWIDEHEQSHVDNTGGVIDGYTSYGINDAFDFFTRDTFLPELVVFPFQEMLKIYNSRANTDNIKIDAFRVSYAWYTKYKTNGRFTMHKHNYGDVTFLNGRSFKPTFSVIYILNDENKSNSTAFFVPHGYLPSIAGQSDYWYETGYNSEIGEGSILIFPTSLYHEVYPSIKPGRITISYNIDCSFVHPETHVSP